MSAPNAAAGRPPLAMLCAGGTGGHLFPAESLATELVREGWRVILVTDERVGAMAENFPAERVITVASATPSGGSPFKRAAAALKLAAGLGQSLRIVRREKPSLVIGFGGYPTVPPVLAAAMSGIPSMVHEQNGVIGRANRLLARYVTCVATGFPVVEGLPEAARGKSVQTGSPVRAAVIEAAQIPYEPPLADGQLRLLVFGGSQGARVFSEIVPAALGLLSPEDRARLRLVQQARGEDEARVREAYAGLGLSADVAPFFKDLPLRMAQAHLVISRSGASTVAELAAIGRPALLVPLPGAIDQDQAANARSLSTIGAATLIPQAEFTAQRLADEVRYRLGDPSLLTQAAQAAKSAGAPDAAEKLAALVVETARRNVKRATPAP